jgi:hypothetical protein
VDQVLERSIQRAQASDFRFHLSHFGLCLSFHVITASNCVDSKGEQGRNFLQAETQCLRILDKAESPEGFITVESVP